MTFGGTDIFNGAGTQVEFLPPEPVSVQYSLVGVPGTPEHDVSIAKAHYRVRVMLHESSISNLSSRYNTIKSYLTPPRVPLALVDDLNVTLGYCIMRRIVPQGPRHALGDGGYVWEIVVEFSEK